MHKKVCYRETSILKLILFLHCHNSGLNIIVMCLFGSDAVNCTAHYLQKITSTKHKLSMSCCVSFFESSTKMAHDNDTVRPVNGNIFIISNIKLVYLLFLI